ncbi:hypothetical protein [Paraburkholderia sp. BCC1885]|uniref:hypothetical protein n=1 Tax=Paraburkholderia sp. BCC1885 TaxID=2562669 RepID=UPI0011834674|nr:hypothetical protein [Paraburkholderia sp. BCC1885]
MATRDNARRRHGRFTLSQRAASELIADIWRAARQWRVYFEEFGVDAAETDQAAPAFRHIDAISTPAMRTLLP